MALPSDIVLFFFFFLGKEDLEKKSLIIGVFRREDILAGKIISREEVLLGKCVVFGAKYHHNYINFWENTLNYGSCNKKTGNPPENHCFLRQVTNVNTNNKVKTTKKWHK